MAGGIWTDPVDVGVEGVPTTLLTNIADDLRSLHKGNGHTTMPTATINSSGQIDIGIEQQTFTVTDPGYGLRFISTAGRQPGNTISIIMAGAGLIYTNAPTPASGYSSIIVNHEQGYTSYNTYQYQLLSLVYTGSIWLCNYVIM